ncbi:GLPGLI family protein [Flavobacterium sp.]|uniref:GLPGLI family protein n=1 Tax=Flavobacterium sp. TaxID=239 RepID=UPI003D0FB020
MKCKLYFVLLCVFTTFMMRSQNNQTAQRFFYEHTFKTTKSATEGEKIITILDVSKDKSIYRDYTVIAQDSILEIEVEKMKKTGVFVQMEKLIKMPKFSYKIAKNYPTFETSYIDGIEKSLYGYKEKNNFDWKIIEEKAVIEGYNCQKATVTYAGRQWEAWFTLDLPFQDGPYKFKGLPGLIVKLSDLELDYQWVLKANKKIYNYNENSFSDNLYYNGNFTVNYTARPKFEKVYTEYKKDPLAAMRGQLKPEMMAQKMPGSQVTYGQMIDNQNKILKEILNSNTNPIELN